MKKNNNNNNNNNSNNNNNRYRTNNNNNRNNNQIYSLNYKFDSSSIAGKYCGTALDLIKRYNELAKEAISNSNYVEAEIFRQYAEHYRKIVTEINERKTQYQATQSAKENEAEKSSESNNVEDAAPVTKETPSNASTETSKEEESIETKPVVKKSFKVIEIAAEKTETESEEVKPKPKRVYRRRTTEAVV